MVTVSWKAFYDTGETFTDIERKWQDLPEHGVLLVVVRDNTGDWSRWIESGQDFFVCYPWSEEPFCTKDTGPFKDALASKGIDHRPWIKKGRQAANRAAWVDVNNKARADADFPPGTTPQKRKGEKDHKGRLSDR